MSEALDVYRAGVVLLVSRGPGHDGSLRRELRRRGFSVISGPHPADAHWDAAVVIASGPAGARMVGELRARRRPVVWIAPLEARLSGEARRHGAVLFYAPVEPDTIADAVDRLTSK